MGLRDRRPRSAARRPRQAGGRAEPGRLRGRPPDRVKNLSATEAVVLALAILGLAVIVQPLQLGIVRTLEGYPLLHGPGTALGPPLAAFQALRWHKTNDKTASARYTPRVRANRSAPGLRPLTL